MSSVTSEPTAVAIIDDRDVAIKYTGSWTEAGISEEFRRGTTSSVVTGDSWALDFEGTSITVVGTRDRDSVMVSYAIDGSVPQLVAYPAPGEALLHQNLFTSPTLVDTKHRLVVKMESNTTGNSVFFDYVLVGLGRNTPKGTLLFVDDESPDIKFSVDSEWVKGSAPRTFGNTLHIGAPAKIPSFTYSFTGTGLSIIGVVTNGTEPATGKVTVDGTAVLIEVPRGKDGPSYNVQFFNVTNLESKAHTLTFETASIGLGIDYLLVQAVEVVGVPLSSAVPGPSSLPGSTGGPNTVSPPAPSGTPAPASAGSIGFRNASMGGAIGPLALFATILFYLKRKF